MGRILGLAGRIARLAMAMGIALVLVGLLRRVDAGRRAATDELPPWRGPAWFRHLVTYRFDPLVMRLGLVGGRRSPWAMVEHVGRRTGTVRRTPILPRTVGDHVLVPLPYGRAVHWVRNIQARGHCRMQLHERVYELDEPQVLAPDAVAELPAWQREGALRRPFEFLRLRIFRTLPGTLDSVPLHAPGVTREEGRVAAPPRPQRAFRASGE